MFASFSSKVLLTAVAALGLASSTALAGHDRDRDRGGRQTSCQPAPSCRPAPRCDERQSHYRPHWRGHDFRRSHHYVTRRPCDNDRVVIVFRGTLGF